MLQISFQNVLQESVSPIVGLGSHCSTPDGREWVYTKMTEAIVLGNVVVPVANTAVTNITSTATNAQGQTVFITESGAAWTPGEFEGGFGVVSDGTGEGQVFKIKTNSVDTLELYADTAIVTALDTTSDLILSRYTTRSEKSAITDKAQNAVGVAQVAFTSGYYGFVLRHGQGTVIAGEVLTVDLSFVTGDDTEGQVLKGTASVGPFDEQALGTVLAANTTVDKGALVMVDIGI